jgi:putative hydrolase
MDNAQIAELLALASDKEEGVRAKALRKAARAALTWPHEAVDVRERDDSLRGLRRVGPWVEKIIVDMLDSDIEPPEPPPVRKGFSTVARATKIVADHPEYRAAIRGDHQMHTLYSDGSVTIQEMAQAAREMGHRQIAITDHSKGLKIAGGIDEATLAQRGREIDGVNATMKPDLVLLRSMEVNVSPQGEVDMDPAALAELDVVLCAFHSKLRVKEDQTDRYLAALRNPSLDVLAHPRGRIFNFRLGLQADWARVCTEAAALDKALEIDGYPDRQDLNIDLLKIARDAGCRISIGTDAHHPDELVFFDVGVAAAIEAGIDPARIINTMEPAHVCAWARTHRTAA